MLSKKAKKWLINYADEHKSYGFIILKIIEEDNINHIFSSSGITLIWVAVTDNDYDLVKFCLSNHADTSIVLEGLTLYEYATMKYDFLECSNKIVNLLKEYQNKEIQSVVKDDELLEEMKRVIKL